MQTREKYPPLARLGIILAGGFIGWGALLLIIDIAWALTGSKA